MMPKIVGVLALVFEVSFVPLAMAQPAPPVAAEPPSATPNAQHRVLADWRHKATGQDLERVYPTEARRHHVEGIAMVACKVTKDGDMADCIVEQEAPQGQGFGAAALALMPEFKMRPMTRNGLPVDGGTMRLPIQFRLPR
ncbi:energy transducer TonB [Phenylobacterium sp.]|jgi:protein TonB|uniref:energy transducer TonB n=1 Tax=Phenylobacterium sp. TaxID=1871053 RepID=UPI002E36C70D|nr:energy transducer TonB [Phenylobacterium sp.]HEX3364694.1 energy transducer TonB [Phenylobacterium sp.]